MTNQNNDFENMYNLEAEQAVLGSIIIAGDSGYLLDEINLKPATFSRPSHRKIYMAMQALAADNKPIDNITLTEYFNNHHMLNDIGGIGYITSLANYVPSARSAKFYAGILKDKALKRAYLEAGERVIEAAKKAEKAEDLQVEIEKIFADVSTQNEQDLEIPNPAQDLADVFANIEARYEKAGRGGLSGIDTGFKKLNECTDGFQKGDFIVLAARPSMGKTALAGNIFTYTAGVKKIPALFISLEMSKGQLLERFTAAMSGIKCEDIQRGSLNKEDFYRLIKVNDDLSKAPLYIADIPALTNINRLEAYARKMKRKTDIQLIIIDYLQLMNIGGKQENRQYEIATISRRLKLLAVDLQIPIMALSQLSRKTEEKGNQNKRPLLSHLRDSGAIEQDADLVMMLYRPDYYSDDKNTQQTKQDNQQTEQNVQPAPKNTTETGTGAELIIAKHRKGSTGTINLAFYKEYCKFEDFRCIKQEKIK